MKAPDILKAGIKHMEDRAKTYDKPEGERSMAATVAAFNAMTGHSLTTEQGWLFQICLKCVRSQQGDYRADNYEDGAAYFSLMGEAAGEAPDIRAGLADADAGRVTPLADVKARFAGRNAPSILEPVDLAELMSERSESSALEMLRNSGLDVEPKILLSGKISDEHRDIARRNKYDILADLIAEKREPSAKTAAALDEAREIREEWDERRMDIIGQNGNDGLHYDALPGWIEWRGGECPAYGKKVDVILRNGKQHSNIHSSAMRWAHIDDLGDVVLYRLHKDASHE